MKKLRHFFREKRNTGSRLHFLSSLSFLSSLLANKSVYFSLSFFYISRFLKRFKRRTREKTNDGKPKKSPRTAKILVSFSLLLSSTRSELPPLSLKSSKTPLDYLSPSLSFSGDLRHHELGQRLPVARLAPVVFLRVELEDDLLVAERVVLEDDGLDLRAFDVGRPHLELAALLDGEHAAQGQGRPGGRGEAVGRVPAPLLEQQLDAADLDDGVGVGGGGGVGGRGPADVGGVGGRRGGGGSGGLGGGGGCGWAGERERVFDG